MPCYTALCYTALANLSYDRTARARRSLLNQQHAQLHLLCCWRPKAFSLHDIVAAATRLCPPSAAQTGLGIQQTLDYYINEGGVPPAKLTLGLGVYGRSWTLNNPANNGVGAPANAPGQTGRCTGGCSGPLLMPAAAPDAWAHGGGRVCACTVHAAQQGEPRPSCCLIPFIQTPQNIRGKNLEPPLPAARRVRVPGLAGDPGHDQQRGPGGDRHHCHGGLPCEGKSVVGGLAG